MSRFITTSFACHRFGKLSARDFKRTVEFGSGRFCYQLPQISLVNQCCWLWAGQQEVISVSWICFKRQQSGALKKLQNIDLYVEGSGRGTSDGEVQKKGCFSGTYEEKSGHFLGRFRQKMKLTPSDLDKAARNWGSSGSMGEVPSESISQFEGVGGIGSGS